MATLPFAAHGDTLPIVKIAPKYEGAGDARHIAGTTVTALLLFDNCATVSITIPGLDAAKLPAPPITRLELTLDPATPFQNISWPKAYAIKTRQAKLNDFRHLTDTERVVLDGILAGAIDLTRLGRKTRLKLEQYMEGYVQWITVSATDYRKVLANLRTLTEYPKVDLGVEVIPDRPPRSQPDLFLPDWVRKAEEAGRISGP